MLVLKFLKDADKKHLNALAQAGTIGLHMVSGVAVGAVIGYFLDQWFETSPWLTGIFLVAGIVAGFKNVYVDTRRLVETQKKEDENLCSASSVLKKAKRSESGRQDKGQKKI